VGAEPAVSARPIEAYDYKTGSHIATKSDSPADFVHQLVVHPTQPWFLCCSHGIRIQLFNFSTNSIILEKVFCVLYCSVTDVKFNPKDPNTFATASRNTDLPISFWAIDSSQFLFGLNGQIAVECIEFFSGSDHPPFIAAGNIDFTITIWNYKAKTCVATFSGGPRDITAFGFYPDRPLLLSTSRDGSLLVWNWITRTREARLDHGKVRSADLRLDT
jgi:coatomer subunit beta'